MEDPPSPDDAPTRPVCAECGEPAHKGGDIVPDEKMVRRRWGFCAFGANWSWCQRGGGRFKRR